MMNEEVKPDTVTVPKWLAQTIAGAVVTGTFALIVSTLQMGERQERMREDVKEIRDEMKASRDLYSAVLMRVAVLETKGIEQDNTRTNKQ